MARARKGRSAVVIVAVSPEWKPSSPNAMPPKIDGARFYSRRLRIRDALAITGAYNRERLSSRSPDATWALAVVTCSHERGVRPAAPKGGAR